MTNSNYVLINSIRPTERNWPKVKNEKGTIKITKIK
jgi:hypothetical protein